MAERSVPLSVVVAVLDAERTLPACLTALERACEGLDAEILAVHPEDERLPAGVREAHPGVRFIRAPAGALVPRLWALGLRTASGEAVAFSTGHCVVGPGWARALLHGLSAGASGVGGAIRLDPSSRPSDWAVYFLRYSTFMPPAPAGDVAEIPGENAAYRRAVLDRHAAALADGFWEVELHRRIRGEGGRLVFAADATAAVGRSFAFGTILGHRFRHGMHSGAFRVRTGVVTRWRGVLAAPLVPAVLATRILRRVARRPALLPRFIISLPFLLVLASAWAAGEAVGSLPGAREEVTGGR